MLYIRTMEEQIKEIPLKIHNLTYLIGASLVAQMVKNLPGIWEKQV